METVYCINNENYRASLELGKAYRVIIDDHAALGCIRVIDESGESYIYPADRFSHDPPQQASA